MRGQEGVGQRPQKVLEQRSYGDYGSVLEAAGVTRRLDLVPELPDDPDVGRLAEDTLGEGSLGEQLLEHDEHGLGQSVLVQPRQVDTEDAGVERKGPSQESRDFGLVLLGRGLEDRPEDEVARVVAALVAVLEIEALFKGELVAEVRELYGEWSLVADQRVGRLLGRGPGPQLERTLEVEQPRGQIQAGRRRHLRAHRYFLTL